MKSYFAENLKTLRLTQNVLQYDFAKVLGVSKSTISGWEVGRNQPDYDMLITLSNYFGVTIDELLKDKL